MDFEFSAGTSDYLQRLGAFMDEHIYPNEERFYAQLGEGNRWEVAEALRGTRRTWPSRRRLEG